MSNQGPPKLDATTPLATNDAVSNVAENQKVAQDLRAANVDGKDIYPQRIFTKDLQLETALTVGSGVQIMDGSINANMLGADSVTSEKVAANAITATELSTGAVTATKINVSDLANIASVYTGSITVGTTGTIGSSATGGWFTPSRLLMKYGGTTKVDLNTSADTYYFNGEVISDNFSLTAGTSATDITDTGGITINNTSATPSDVQKLSLKYSGNEVGYIYGGDQGLEIDAVSGGRVQIGVVGATGELAVEGATAYANSHPVVVTSATTNQKIAATTLSVSVTGTGAFATGTWTHGWDTSTDTVYFVATARDFDTTKVAGISNVRVERTSFTTCKVEFLVATYASTETVYFDVMAIGPA